MSEKDNLDWCNWMRYLDGRERVIDSYIPGSHDSSAYHTNEFWGDISHELGGAITQSQNYYGQLCAGIRYFDMRVQRADLKDDYLTMHHGLANFERLDTVLRQIRTFADAHKSEFFILDFDFPFGNDRDHILENMLKKALRKELGEENFATAHVDQRLGSKRYGYYNTALTWDALREHKKQYIIIWQGQIESKLKWAPNADKIRNIGFEDGHFDWNTAETILTFLDWQLKHWKRENLYVTDLVNTPFFSPTGGPESRDRSAYGGFLPWILLKYRPENLGIVRHDFVNEEEEFWDKRRITAHIIRMNKFLTTSGPNKAPRKDALINFNDNINLMLRDGRHLFVDEKYGSEISFVSAAKLEKINEGADAFLLQHCLPGRSWPVNYVGNRAKVLNAQTCMFRLVHHDKRSSDNVGDKVVLSVGTEIDLGDQIYWGRWQEDAANLESFFFYDPDNLYSEDTVHDGDLVLIQSENDDKWWKVITDETKNPPTVRVAATATSPGDATQFTIMGVGPKFPRTVPKE